ncbi:MAG: HigA family addiction module antidote protein [Maricaulaceae bacterium]|nr:HigA family addiction module antidote protein [Maricaulaceae bacterium]
MTWKFLAPTETVGEHLKKDFMPEYGVKAPTLARKLGVPRARLVRLLNGAACDGDMAIRLARAFGTTPEFWLNIQMLHDLSRTQAERGAAIEAQVEPLAAA